MMNLNSSKILRKKLNPVDSGIAFLGAIITFIAASTLFILTLTVFFSDEIIQNSGYLDKLLEMPWVITLSTIVTQGSLLAFAIILCKSRRVDLVPAIKMDKKPNIFILLIIPILALFLIVSNLPILAAVEDLFRRIGYQIPDVSMDLQSPKGIIMAVIVMCAIPAFFEELIFRGFVLQGLASRFKPFTAIILSSLAFSLMHMSPAQTVHQFLIGIVLAYIVLATDSIWSGILLHFFNNFWAIMIEVFNINGVVFPFMDNIIFIYVGGIFVTILGLVAIFLAIDFANKDVSQGNLAQSIKRLVKRQKYTGYKINYDVILPPAFPTMPMTETDYNNYVISRQKSNRRVFIILYSVSFAICVGMWILSLMQGVLQSI